MHKRTYDKVLFLAAAAFNLISAATLLLLPHVFLTRLGITDPAATLLARSLASSATTWGIGYALVAINPQRYRPFALLGAISKTIFGLVYTIAFLQGLIPFSAFLPALVEFLFVALFLEFIWRTRG